MRNVIIIVAVLFLLMVISNFPNNAASVGIGVDIDVTKKRLTKCETDRDEAYRMARKLAAIGERCLDEGVKRGCWR